MNYINEAVSNSATVSGLPDIVSVQKKITPLLYTDVVSYQPTEQPVATAYGLIQSESQLDDGSGWTQYDFEFRRWQHTVESKKLKTEISIELLQDMAALGLSSDVVAHNLADQIAKEVNKDIIHALTNISQIGDKIIVNEFTSTFEQARDLYLKLHYKVADLERATGIKASYVVAGGKCFDLLLGSTYAKMLPGTNTCELKSGLKLVHDVDSDVDYLIVGVKKNLGDFELSSLVYSPYLGCGEHGMSFHTTSDSKNFHPVIGVIHRSALTVAPVTKEQVPRPGLDDMEIDWDNLGTKENSSPLSVYYEVTEINSL